MAVKKTPVTQRALTSAGDLQSLSLMIEALESSERGDLYISKAVIRIENGNGYPVGHLVREVNDEEYNFVAWDDAQDA